MKKFSVVYIVLAILLAAFASAADVTVSTTSLAFSDAPTRSFSLAFTVSNATANLSGVTLTQSGLDVFKTNFTLGGAVVTGFNLSFGEAAKTIYLNGAIPKNINTKSGVYNGAITIAGAGINAKTINVAITPESQLEFDNVKAKHDGKSKTFDEGDQISDVEPGTKLDITGDIQNLFTDEDDDPAIEDIEITITIEGIDDDDDLEETIDVGDVDADDDDSFSASFEMPDDVEENEYDITIEAEGEDENGATHYVKLTGTVEISKDKHDVWVTDLTVSPSTVSCNRNFDVNVDLKNQGTEDEDEVVVKIESAALAIKFEDTSLPELSEGTGDDTEYSKKYSFTVGDKIAAGTYSIIVKSYYGTDTLSDSKTVDLKVEKCVVETPVVVEQPTTPSGNNDVVVITSPDDEEETFEPDVITEPVTETTEGTSLLQSKTYPIFLIGAVGIALVVVIILLVVLMSMKKRDD